MCQYRCRRRRPKAGLAPEFRRHAESTEVPTPTDVLPKTENDEPENHVRLCTSRESRLIARGKGFVEIPMCPNRGSRLRKADDRRFGTAAKQPESLSLPDIAD